MKTFLAKKETVQPKWHLIDAEGVPLGRLAVKAANIILADNDGIVAVSAPNKTLMGGVFAPSKGCGVGVEWFHGRYLQVMPRLRGAVGLHNSSIDSVLAQISHISDFAGGASNDQPDI